MTTLAAGLVLAASYLIGAIPFGYLVARWRGVDILKQGSGNIGATNVGRVLGRRLGLLVFLLDFAKGAVPAAVAASVVPADSELPPDVLRVGAGLAAFLGHVYPIYLRFRGGKGVATGAGVVTVLLPLPALAAFLVWLATVLATRYISLASLLAAAALCIARLWLTADPFSSDHLPLTLFCFVAAGLVLLRHRGNVARLFRGTENRLKDTPAMHLLGKTVHVLALGLWFGSAVFFSLIAALVIFHAFEALAADPARPAWLPESFDKEKGTQLAGVAVGPIFPWYFLVQGVCGLLALATALPWSRLGPRVHRVRLIVLALAMATVLAGWPLVQKVSELRSARYSADATVAAQAKADFGAWHGYSLLLNFVTLALVGTAMALAAQLSNGDRAKETPV